jgi:Zn-dependent peptidase ImmA (M78 family)
MEERNKAVKARQELGINPYETIENIENLLFKKANISILKRPLMGEISGLCSRKEDTMAILVNSNYSLGRQFFTIAHEYYHLKYDDNLNEYSREKETKANTFASYFLMPKEALEFYLSEKKLSLKKDELSPDDIVNISVYFKLSYSAVLVRLKNYEKLLSKDKFETYKNLNPLILAKKNGIHTNLYHPTTITDGFVAKTDYIMEVKKALEADKISFGKYESLLLEGGFEDVVYGFETIDEVVKDGKIEDYI